MVVHPIILQQIGTIQLYHYGQKGWFGEPVHIFWQCTDRKISQGPFPTMQDALNSAHTVLGIQTLSSSNEKSNVIKVDFKLRRRV